MGATIQRRGKSYRVAVHQDGKREYKTVRDLQTAKDLVKLIAKQELAGINVVESIQQARTPATEYPLLKDALPQWIADQVAAGEIRASTARVYTERCKTWLSPALGSRPVSSARSRRQGAHAERSSRRSTRCALTTRT